MSHSDFPGTIQTRQLIGGLKLLRGFRSPETTVAALVDTPLSAELIGLGKLGILLNGGPGVTLQEISSGDGGDLIAGIDNVRPFNLILVDDAGEVRPEGNGRFLFPAGTYKVRADLPGLRVGHHVAWLRIDPDGVNIVAVSGRSETAQLAGGPNASDSHTHVDGAFVLIVPTSIEFQHRCEFTNTGDGMGSAVQPAGSPIQATFVHGIAHFTKIA